MQLPIEIINLIFTFLPTKPEALLIKNEINKYKVYMKIPAFLFLDFKNDIHSFQEYYFDIRQLDIFCKPYRDARKISEERKANVKGIKEMLKDLLVYIFNKLTNYIN